MFNWLKRKRNNLLPADIEKGMMTSNFCVIKLGNKITIPENCVCFITYKDRTFGTLQAGTYSLNKDLLLDLYQKQLKGNKQLKKLKVDFFFVNSKDFSYSFDYIDKVPINKKLSKLIFTINLNLNVNDCEKFCSKVLAEYASVNAISCEKLVLEHIENLIRQFFLHIELEDFSIPDETHNQLKEKLTRQLAKIGLNLNLLKISINAKSTIEQKSSFFEENSINENFQTKDENIIDQNENLYYNEQQSMNSPAMKTLTHCPNCDAKIIKGSLYCHRCGKTLK